MDESSRQVVDVAVADPSLPDGIRLRRWLAAYGVFLAAAGAWLAILVVAQTSSWQQWAEQFVGTFSAMSATAKLLAFAIYMSLCCTFLPMPTGWIVSALALPGVAVGPNIWTTTLLIAAVGGAGSTIANLNDYHLFTWVLRSRRVARVRSSRLYHSASRWFTKAPFALLVIFNILPIPVDVVRILATTHRYPRAPFAAANFIGRFIRYAVIAAATYLLGSDGWIAAAALLAVAALLGIERGATALIRTMRRRRAQEISS
ncbi:hypothetical protein LCGC14_0093920 [marine sediment metagenome]|uniref:VTT domain-containing protein n=1 Tax=marine sediment metagenome TaxID=412755 RepID=A0A0F9VU63_9ZZZZ|nr:hypothetical protein [Phycisphaerae bacterium]HDZ43528.1 hypothetical protein [Phycisphaerae bacterium]